MTPFTRPFKAPQLCVTSLLFLSISACSNAPTAPPAAATQTVTHLQKAPQSINPPPDTLKKAGKILQLGRILDGGACKNPQQGIKASFLLYACAEDIKRIKLKQGTKIFTKLEKTITDFSLSALQKVVNKFDYKSESPQQFATLFKAEVAPSIKHFQNSSGLTIAVKPQADELVIYTTDCKATEEAITE